MGKAVHPAVMRMSRNTHNLQAGDKPIKENPVTIICLLFTCLYLQTKLGMTAALLHCHNIPSCRAQGQP
jgi:hypothetical protein